MSKYKRLSDSYRFHGFTPFQSVKGIFGDPKARVIILKRSPKKQFVQSVEKRTGVFMIVESAVFGTLCGDTRVFLELEIRRVQCRSCHGVKHERFDFLANNPFYTKRFAMYIGERCRSSTISDVAKEFRLDWKTVKELDKQYMQEQLRRAPQGTTPR